MFINPGEVVFGPAAPDRVKTKNCLGIYYGEGKGLDACNIFARVADEDFDQLAELGHRIWRNGDLKVTFRHSAHLPFTLEKEIR